jgi:hypothetical protein
LLTGKHGGIPSREERELDCHRAELQRLLATARQAKLKYKSSMIPAVPPGMAWTAKPMVLLNSRLWKSLGIYERRFLEALEIEHCRHAGKEKRFLILTYDQATQHGIKRSRFAIPGSCSIPSAAALIFLCVPALASSAYNLGHGTV